jgi:fructokinase
MNSPSGPRVVALGELLWDLLPDGPCLGGAPANVAFHATRAGGRGALISCVGTDELGERAVRQLGAAGVDVTWVGRSAGYATGTVGVHFDTGEPHYTIGRNAAWDQLEIPADVERQVASTDALAFGTLAARTERTSERILDLVRGLRGCRAPTAPGGLPRPLLALDLNLRPPHVNLAFIRQALELVDLLKLNEEEHAWLEQQGLGESWRGQSTNIRLVALTRGPRGAELSGRGLSATVAGIPVSGGDPIGAGDAFLASLLVALGQGKSPAMSLEVANQYAAGVAATQGAMA